MATIENIMKWDDIDKRYLPGDFSLDFWFHGNEIDYQLLVGLGEVLERNSISSKVTEYNAGMFSWDNERIKEIIDEGFEFIETINKDPEFASKKLILRTEIPGIDINISVRKHQKFVYSIAYLGLEFNESHIIGREAILNYDFVKSLFLSMIQLFLPPYAEAKKIPGITEDWYWDKGAEIDTTKVPISIQWMNYFSNDWVSRIGKRKFEKLAIGELLKNDIGGISYFLQEEPFDWSNSEHAEKIKLVNKKLNLSSLHRKFKNKFWN